MKMIAFGVGCVFALTVRAAAGDVDVRQDPVVRAVDKTLPMVVNISTDIVVRYRDPWADMMEEFFGREIPGGPRERQLERHSLGSGVIIDSAGYVLTNAHVVARATRIHVVLSDQSHVEGKLVATDSRNDLALVKIESPKSLPFIELVGEKDIALGETVIAIGNPFGLGHSVSQGILSARNRKMRMPTGATFDDILQTDAAVNPGNSGGPLIDINGKLLGIITAIQSPTRANVGIGFAIPAWRVTDWLEPESRKVWFGASVLQNAEGIFVSKIEPNGPAAQAGLRRGDRITKVGDTAINAAVKLYIALLEKKNGDTVKVTVDREGKAQTLSVALASTPTADANKMAWEKLGLRFAEANGNLAISEVEAESPAGKAKLQNELILVRIAGEQARSLDELADVLAKTKSGDRLAVALAKISRRGGFISQSIGEITLTVR